MGCGIYLYKSNKNVAVNPGWEGKYLDKNAEKNVSPLFFLKCLLFSYILTAVLLMLLALILYKTGLGEGMVSIAVIAIYVVANLFAGFVAGKKMQSRKFLWGFMMGCAYFVVLAFVSLIVNHSVGELGSSFFTTLVLCAGGGMLGGMVS